MKMILRGGNNEICENIWKNKWASPSIPNTFLTRIMMLYFSFVICASVAGNSMAFCWLAWIFCWTNLLSIEVFLEGFSFRLVVPCRSDGFAFALVNAACHSLPPSRGIRYETITKELWKILRIPYYGLFYSGSFCWEERCCGLSRRQSWCCRQLWQCTNLQKRLLERWEQKKWRFMIWVGFPPVQGSPTA